MEYKFCFRGKKGLQENETNLVAVKEALISKLQD